MSAKMLFSSATPSQVPYLTGSKEWTVAANKDGSTMTMRLLQLDISVKDKRSRQKMKYDTKEYASGRVGFLWSGGVGGIISRLEIVGKVDWKRMAKELRDKAPK